MHVIDGDSQDESTDKNSSLSDNELLNSTNEDVGKTVETKCKVLYLFSGPLRADDGFDKFRRDEGYECDCIDIEVSLDHDVKDQTFWESLRKRLREYDGYLLSPPCGTFTAARNFDDGGPPPLRGTSGKDAYGFGNLGQRDLEKVKEGNLCAFRCVEVMEIAEEDQKPWILEQPHQREGATSMFNLQEFVDLKPATILESALSLSAPLARSSRSSQTYGTATSNCRSSQRDVSIRASTGRFRGLASPPLDLMHL